LKFSQEIFEKHSNIKFHENPSSGNRLVPCGRTDVRTDGQTDKGTDEDKHEKDNSRVSQFCERA